jgi:hypothetical protein
MHTKPGEDPSTYPKYDSELWLEVGATGGPNKNQIYDISITMTQDLMSGCSVSTVGTPQSYSRHPSSAVKELVDEQVGALKVEIEAKYEEESRKQWEKMMAYLSSHYRSPY